MVGREVRPASNSRSSLIVLLYTSVETDAVPLGGGRLGVGDAGDNDGGLEVAVSDDVDVRSKSLDNEDRGGRKGSGGPTAGRMISYRQPPASPNLILPLSLRLSHSHHFHRHNFAHTKINTWSPNRFPHSPPHLHFLLNFSPFVLLVLHEPHSALQGSGCAHDLWSPSAHLC